MNIRRISSAIVTGGIVGLLAVAALGPGPAQAASLLCLEAGPEGPRTVPCPIELPAVESAVAGNAAFDRLLDSLADIAIPAKPADAEGQDESAEPEMCELTLADGRVIELPCMGQGIGDIVFNPNPGTDEPPAEESPADEPATDERPIIPEGSDDIPEEPVAPEDDPVADEPVMDEPVEDAMAEDDAIDEPIADEPVTEERPLDELSAGDDTADEVGDAPVDSDGEIETDIAASETAETGEEVVSGGALPRTGVTTMGITVGLALMGLGGGAFAKIAAGRRRR
jgi:hypothetical protein